MSTWSLSDLERHKEKIEEGKIRELINEEASHGANGVAAQGDGREAEAGFEDEFRDAEIDLVMMEVET